MTTLPERFWDKVDLTNDCWLWTAGMARGYGRYNHDGLTRFAHRLAYEDLVGPIPEGALLDHLCHRRACVRPTHLRIADYQLNAQNRAGAQVNSRSGVRGVFRQGDKWRVQVKAGGRIHSGGLFASLDDAEEAAVALRAELMETPICRPPGVE